MDERPTHGRDPDGPASRGTSSRPSVRLSGADLSDFFFSIPATVWTTDDHLVLTFVHGTYLNRLQINPNKVVGRTVQDILLDGREDHPLIQGHLTALSGHETTVRVEWGGRLYTMRLAPLRNSDDRVIGCVGVHLEIGWLPDDEGTLRESDVRLRRVVDANPMGIAFGNDQGHITDANDAFLQLAGYSREDLVGDGISWPALMPVETHQRQIHALEEIQTTGRCAPFETEVIRRDGHRVPVLVGAVRLSVRRREGVAFVLDISDRKNAVRRLTAELACADALAEAHSPHDLAGLLHDVFTTGLACPSVAMWTTAGVEMSQGPARLEDDDAKRSVDALAAQVLATGREVFWAERNTFALPLRASGRCHGALVLSDWSTAPDADVLETCRRIADRIGRFLETHSQF